MGILLRTIVGLHSFHHRDYGIRLLDRSAERG
jgi:hypothetical protein